MLWVPQYQNFTVNAGVTVAPDAWDGSTGGWVVDSIPFNTLPSWLRGPGVPNNIPYRLNPDIALHSSGGNPFGGAYSFYFNGSIDNDTAGITVN